jgi:hypothetical protein
MPQVEIVPAGFWQTLDDNQGAWLIKTPDFLASTVSATRARSQLSSAN